MRAHLAAGAQTCAARGCSSLTARSSSAASRTGRPHCASASALLQP
jgi:hypothetical protein